MKTLITGSSGTIDGVLVTGPETANPFGWVPQSR